MQHLQPNTTLQGGKYRIERVLGQGGFGNTYVGYYTEFEETVAIKEFFMKGVTERNANSTTVSVSNSENVDSFLQQKEKFKKEARRLRQLDNPHIVKVHDLFEENGTAYYVMDYVDGENLSERLKRTSQPMSEEEVNEILPQILDALKTVHDAGIWHLDLKPANIMVDKGGQVKLIDFGASKQMDTQKGGATSSTAISYTNGFAPREQMEQNYDKFGPWTDIYALGATLYNLLTNQRPPLPTDIDDDISEDKHVALPMLGVSDKMKQFVIHLLSTSIKQRPTSVAALEKTIEDDKYQHESEYDALKNNHEETIVAGHVYNSFIPDDSNTKESSNVNGIPKTASKSKVWFWGLFLLGIIIVFGTIIYTSKLNKPLETNKNIDSIVVSNNEEMNYQLVFPDGKYFYEGYFTDSQGSYPVEVQFECIDNNIQNCVYKNVSLGGKIKMNGFHDNNAINLEGKDGNNSFRIYLKNNGSIDSFSGEALDGNKKLSVSLSLSSKEIIRNKTTNNDDEASFWAKLFNDAEYVPYYNERFEYKVYYPNFMKREEEPMNGGGLSFTYREVTLSTYGYYDFTEGDVDEMYKTASENATYKFKKQNFFIVSGVRSNLIFYSKYVLLNDVWFVLELSYPPKYKEYMNPLINHVQSFNPIIE